jgi:hypothetical protein
MTNLKDLLKIRLKKNSKLPTNKWSDKKNHFKELINLEGYNTGILTGKINNLIVVDIDTKDDGIQEFKKYIDEYGEPMTVKQQTQSGGHHYFFNYNHNDKKCEYLVQNYLPNKSKYRNKGIDIRANGGYIVAPGSVIDKKEYKFIRSFEQCDVLDIPESLINFLLFEETFINLQFFELDDIEDIQEKRKIQDKRKIKNILTTEEIKKIISIEPKKEKQIIINNDNDDDNDNNDNNNNNNNNNDDNDDNDDNDNDDNDNNDKDEQKMKSNITDEEIKKLLSLLPTKYNDNYNEWLKITTILKNENKFNLWDEWSKNSTNYNLENNIQIWNKNKGAIDINYLIFLVNFENKTKLKPIEKYKIMEKLDDKNLKCNIKTINNNFLLNGNENLNNCSYDDFLKNDTLIIQSCTGTGKTSAISKHIKEYIKNEPRTKIISLITRKTLEPQHIKNFKEHDINLTSYTDDERDLETDHIIICINSLHQYKNIPSEYFKNCIVLIDEVNSFSVALTHNDTINGERKIIYSVINKLINNCKKAILMDAHINNSVFKLIESRKQPEQLFIKNTFQKYKDVDAVNIKDEHEFIKLMIEETKQDNLFVLGSDSSTEAKKIYYKCLEDNPDKQNNKFELITADSGAVVLDAAAEYEDKFIFFSPKITIGIDLSYDKPRNVYIYIKGQSINPAEIFQQATRIRNINKLYYFSSSSSKEPKYNSLLECKEIHKRQETTTRAILECSVMYDNENEEELKINENKFFDIYIENEYMFDTYATNKTKHFELILHDTGFKLSSKGEQKIISIDENKKLLKPIYEAKEEFFNNYMNDENKNLDKYECINKKVELLKIPKENDELLIEYKNIITDEFKFKSHLNVLISFKTYQYIQEKINELEFKNMNVINNDSIYHKISVLKTILKEFIGDECIYNIDYQATEDKKIKVNDDILFLIKRLFRTTKEPKNMKDFKQLHITILKHITDNDIIISKQKKENNKRSTQYKLNDKFINFHIDLDRLKNPTFKNYDIHVIKKLNILSNEDNATKIINANCFNDE